MNDSENKKQVNKVYTPKGGNDKASPSQLKPMGTQHPINVLDMTPMGKIVKKLLTFGKPCDRITKLSA